MRNAASVVAVRTQRRTDVGRSGMISESRKSRAPGKPEDAELLEPLLKDKSIVATTFLAGGPGVNKRVPVQTRDVALAMCALLRKQDPADYGLLARTKSTNDAVKYNIAQHYFDDADGDADKKRDDAVKKYEDWKVTDKKKN